MSPPLPTFPIWQVGGDGVKCKNTLKDVTVEPTPQITGNTELPRHSNLSNLDLKGCYSTAQKKGGDNAATGEGGIGIDYEEFLWIMGLCGHIKCAPSWPCLLSDRVSSSSPDRASPSLSVSPPP